jgi:hypothetical protein
VALALEGNATDAIRPPQEGVLAVARIVMDVTAFLSKVLVKKQWSFDRQSLFCPGPFAAGEDFMTAWLSNSDLSDQAQRARGNNTTVLCMAMAVVVAIALLLVVSRDHPIPSDAVTYFIGP